jgi:spore coat protein CotH
MKARWSVALLILLSAASFGNTVDDFFNDAELHEIRLFIHPSDWQRLKDNFESNEYYPCDLEWRGLVAQNIGIRSRGLGSRSGVKPGLKVDFSRYDKNFTFLGMKSFVLDNQTQDPSMVREGMSMALFRLAGIRAPKQAYARLSVNGQYVGLYSMSESVDKRFLRNNFGEDTGHLYDYEWAFAYWFEDLGRDPELYSPVPFKPETRESEPVGEHIAELVRRTHQLTTEEFVAGLGGVLSWKQFFTYLAVEMYLAESDGLLGTWGINNFYLYRASSGQFEFIPWDKDVTFSDPETSIWRNAEANALTRRAFESEQLRAMYVQTLDRVQLLADGFLGPDLERRYTLIRRAALEDPVKPYTNEEFEADIEFLRYFIRERPERVASEMSREIRSARPARGDPCALNETPCQWQKEDSREGAKVATRRAR